MEKFELGGTWKLSFDNTNINVMVPGVIEKDLEKRDVFTDFHFQRKFSMNLDKTASYILHCEGISYHAMIYINHNFVKEVEGIWEPHCMEIQEYLQNGENEIEVVLQKPDFDKHSRFYYRSVLFGFIPDVLFPFGGIYKDIYIEEKTAAYFKQTAIYMDYENHNIVVESDCDDATCEVAISIDSMSQGILPYSKKICIPMGQMDPWSPQCPRLYTVQVQLLKQNVVIDEETAKLGYRRISMKEHQIYLNEKPIYFRAVLHWGYYPEHMEIIPSKERVKQELLDIKAQGFQAIKFCLFLPPSYYFDLCDELGILVWQELPLWLPYDNGYLFDRIAKQYPAIMSQCRNHASLFMVSLGCELDTTIPKETLDGLYKTITELKTEAIVCDNSGSGECYDGAVQSQSDIYDYHFYGEIHNMQTLIHEYKHQSRIQKPWFFGEYNDMDTFRDLTQVKSQSDYELYWANPERSRNLLRYVHADAVSDMPIYYYERISKENELDKDMNQLISCANQKAYDVRKYNLETTRRNDINGYSITAIRDVPITSCGIFDDFGNKKWSDEEMQRVNGDIVLSMSAPLKRKWHNGADIFQSLDEYNFLGHTTLANFVHLSNHTENDGLVNMRVELLNQNECVSTYTEDFTLQAYTSMQVSQLQLLLPNVEKPTQYCLKISVQKQNQKITENIWSIWVYPRLDRRVQLFDPTGQLQGIDEVMKVTYIREIKEVKEGVFVTTVLNDNILHQLPEQVSIIYLQSGEGYFPIQREPFWRECVRLIKTNTCFDHLATKGYDSLQFISFSSDVTILPKDIHALVGDYQQIMTRIDNRRFHRSECIFTFEKSGHSILACTIGFQKGSGTQARSFAENIFAQQVLHEMIKTMEGYHVISES